MTDGREGYGHSMRNLVVRLSRFVSESRKREEGLPIGPLDPLNPPASRPITPEIVYALDFMNCMKNTSNIRFSGGAPCAGS